MGQCQNAADAYAQCTHDRTFSIVWACRDLFNALQECTSQQYEPNSVCMTTACKFRECVCDFVDNVAEQNDLQSHQQAFKGGQLKFLPSETEHELQISKQGKQLHALAAHWIAAGLRVLKHFGRHVRTCCIQLCCITLALFTTLHCFATHYIQPHCFCEEVSVIGIQWIFDDSVAYDLCTSDRITVRTQFLIFRCNSVLADFLLYNRMTARSI